MKEKTNQQDKDGQKGSILKTAGPDGEMTAAHSTVVLKAETMAEKVEWLNKLRNVIQPSAGGQVKGESGLPLQQSLSNGSLDTVARRPTDPEEELWWMSQEFHGYVEAVLNSLGAHVPKPVVLCQGEKAKEDMLNQLYSSIRKEAERSNLSYFPEVKSAVAGGEVSGG
ncbi:hypothetical protein NL676_039879 [Syzygium grande]|nr:hypothetical protein NL676_039879 [Syzygium grande]